MNMTKKVALLILSLGLLLQSPAFATSILTSMSDSVNSGIINTKIFADDMLSNTDIDATVVNGIAIFSGEVNSKAQVNELIRIAHSVSGIKGINISRLRIVK